MSLIVSKSFIFDVLIKPLFFHVDEGNIKERLVLFIPYLLATDDKSTKSSIEKKKWQDGGGLLCNIVAPVTD